LQLIFSMLTQTIPVLDLHHFSKGSLREQSQFVQALGNALQKVGFFALENHGIDTRLLQAAYGAAEAFFALASGVKGQYEDPALKGQRGFTCFGKEHAKDSSVPDLKEFWHVGRERPNGELLPGSMPNLWPQEVPQFRPLMIGLFEQLETCAEMLLQACAQYLEQPSDFFTQDTREGNSILRIIHYPPITEAMPAGSLRAAPHEDINLITLLCEATASGLELLQSDGTWLAVPAIPGQIIVDAGDMLQALSNGLIKSTTHRVTNPANMYQRRFSMPFFVHPQSDFDLTPLPQCVTKTGGVRRYPQQSAGEYLAKRLQEIGLG
jgi:isopenicillin N synthase-like dioxygenase